MREISMMSLTVSDDDPTVGYLKLPRHHELKEGVVNKTIYLHEVINNYKGPDINLDFNEDGFLIGIEIVG